jgi:hypothetical protein
MKNVIRAEEAAILAFAVFLNQTTLPFAWWWYWALFLAPDISMVGYLLNTRVGAVIYNIVHHKGTAVLCYMLGLLLVSPIWQFTGLLLLGHSAFDRIFGYGLKFPDHFKHTHLGWIGDASKS